MQATITGPKGCLAARGRAFKVSSITPLTHLTVDRVPGAHHPLVLESSTCAWQLDEAIWRCHGQQALATIQQS
jgi:hypothetical protein